MVDDGHHVDCEPAHVLGDGEGQVAEVVLVIEDHRVFHLLVSPLNIRWVSKLVLCASENCDWEVKLLQVIIWRSALAVSLFVLFPAVVVSYEAFSVVVNQLGIMDQVSVSSASWQVGHVNVISACIVDLGVSISKHLHN